jgi:NAD(P)-dependent dehydrogenase (short-subunit alcohol dehydrogenase family)
MTTQVVLITGALTGIGRATAFAFAKEGSRIVISGRRKVRNLLLNSAS